MIKLTLIVLSIATGYFLPDYPVKSLPIFIVGIVLAIYLGWETPYMMNKESLTILDDPKKATLGTQITLSRKNTHGLWIGVFLSLAAVTNFFKFALLHQEVSKISIFLFVFGIPAILKVYDFKARSKMQ